MIVARCPDKLMCLSYCDVITIYTASLGLKFLGLKRHYMRQYFNGPKQPESHYDALLNIFLYMYVSYCMPFQHFEN